MLPPLRFKETIVHKSRKKDRWFCKLNTTIRLTLELWP